MNTINNRGRIRSFLICLVPSFVIMMIQNAAVVFGSEIYVVWRFLEAAMGHEGSMESFFSGLSSTAFLMSVSLLYALSRYDRNDYLVYGYLFPDLAEYR